MGKKTFDFPLSHEEKLMAQAASLGASKCDPASCSPSSCGPSSACDPSSCDPSSCGLSSATSSCCSPSSSSSSSSFSSSFSSSSSYATAPCSDASACAGSACDPAVSAPSCGGAAADCGGACGPAAETVGGCAMCEGPSVTNEDLTQLSISELKKRLTVLGVDFSMCVEKKEMVRLLKDADGGPVNVAASPSPSPAPSAPSYSSMSVSELKREMSKRGISAEGCLSKADLVEKLEAPTSAAPSSSSSSFSATSQSAMASSVQAVDISTWSLPRLQQLAAERNISFSSLRVLSKDYIIQEVRDVSLKMIEREKSSGGGLSGWLGAHDHFRQLAVSMVSDVSRVIRGVGSGVVGTEQAVSILSSVSSNLDRLNGALHGHGGWEERTIFKFLDEEFSTFHDFNVQLSSEHGHSHQLSDEIHAHISIWMTKEAAAGNWRRLDRIQSLLNEYAVDLHRHLSAEEDSVVPLLGNLNPQQSARFNQVMGGGASACGGASSSSCGGGASGGCGGGASRPPSSCGGGGGGCGGGC
eukprot:TRINITY_DN225_c0_g1_i1.p1 TRINITY_DN225_c0_g1~~TRINITY_DN225_c0_g1_i1.p1  ORF type:complete len:554 (+),score=179.48 TRINITY_DN225_c0_g1_i1:86-1663(+)